MRKVTKTTSPKKKIQIVKQADIVEEVLIAEDPEIEAIQEEKVLPEEVVDDEGWGESSSLRKAQLGEVGEEVVPFEELEKRQMQKALGNKTITYSDDDDTPRQMWNETYFEE